MPTTVKNIKAFVTISEYMNNAYKQSSNLGELSTWSLTYSKDKGEYENTLSPGYKVITFKAIDTSTNDHIVVQQEQINQIIDVVKDGVAFSLTHIRPYTSDTIDDFRAVINANFNGRIGNLNFGRIIDNGYISLPEWMSWNSIEHGGNIIKIWLSDQAFSDQYDEYDITVIPPVMPVDALFGPFGTVSDLLTERPLSALADIVQEAKEENPETYFRILDFKLVNKFNATQFVNTSWAILIYGQTGDNLDSIKDAIIEYVLGSSGHNNAEWEVIIPDLFKRTEFVIIPRWDKVSIPNLTELAGLYSSILDPVECITFAKTNTPFYTPTFINNNVNIIPYDYKGISMIIINGVSNIAGKKKITDLFSDYIPVPSTSADFNRMQFKTRGWVLLMERLLIAAEVIDDYSSVPSKLRRIKRNNILYVSGIYDNVHYLVAAKSNAFF